eukprot:scaffold194719_cov30-Tisochrysis_lutea.AAC.3
MESRAQVRPRAKSTRECRLGWFCRFGGSSSRAGGYKAVRSAWRWSKSGHARSGESVVGHRKSGGMPSSCAAHLHLSSSSRTVHRGAVCTCALPAAGIGRGWGRSVCPNTALGAERQAGLKSEDLDDNQPHRPWLAGRARK